MQISGAWHALHAIAEMEWVHSSVTIATRTFKFYQTFPSYEVTRPSKYSPFRCYDNTVVMSFRFSNRHALHAMLMRFSSYIPVLSLKSQRLKFSHTNNSSQINKFFVVIASPLCPFTEVQSLCTVHGVKQKSAINALRNPHVWCAVSSPNLALEPICGVVHICKQRQIVVS